MPKKTPTIFLSYCRANSDVADAIDNDFKAIGITFRRDIRDVAYRSNIKEFMNTIGESDFVLMLISDEFLKSDWCMYEVTELLNTHKFHDKILPIILENANPVFKLKGRLPYYEYWNNQVEEHNQLLAKFLNSDLIEIIRRYKNVVNHLDTFFTKITELNQLSIEALKQQNYRPILELVDFDDQSLLEEVLAIWQISDQEEKEIALEDFGSKYLFNQYYFFSKAFFEGEQKKYRKAKKSYLEAIRINPDYVDAQYNIGLLLANYLQDYEGAKTHYLKTIQIDSQAVDAHYNLGLLLNDHFQDYEGAKTYYLKALRINPNYTNAHFNLSILLNDHFQDYKGAKTHYLEVLRINPEAVDALNNLGLLLANHFQDYEGAKMYYLQALHIYPKSAKTHNNLALIFEKNLNDSEKAREHYVIAIQLDPSLINEEADTVFGIER